MPARCSWATIALVWNHDGGRVPCGHAVAKRLDLSAQSLERLADLIDGVTGAANQLARHDARIVHDIPRTIAESAVRLRWQLFPNCRPRRGAGVPLAPAGYRAECCCPVSW